MEPQPPVFVVYTILIFLIIFVCCTQMQHGTWVRGQRRESKCLKNKFIVLSGQKVILNDKLQSNFGPMWATWPKIWWGGGGWGANSTLAVTGIFLTVLDDFKVEWADHIDAS